MGFRFVYDGFNEYKDYSRVYIEICYSVIFSVLYSIGKGNNVIRDGKEFVDYLIL